MPEGGSAAPQGAPEPFADRFRALKDDASLSFRQIAARTRKIDGRGLSHGYLTRLANGSERPVAPAMRLIAEALEQPPSVFLEFEAAEVLAAFDYRHQSPSVLAARLSALRELSAETRERLGLEESDAAARQRLRHRAARSGTRTAA